jgi:hypothetical protein
MMSLAPCFDVAGPGLVAGLLVFGVVFVFILFMLIVLVETVTLQLMHWGNFKSSLKASVLMNLASTLLGLVLLWLVPALGFVGIAIAWALSVLIEWWVLTRLHQGENRRNLLIATVANLASYILLIVPSYLLSS